MTGFEEIKRKPADHKKTGHGWSDTAFRRASLLSDITPGLS